MDRPPAKKRSRMAAFYSGEKRGPQRRDGGSRGVRNGGRGKAGSGANAGAGGGAGAGAAEATRVRPAASRPYAKVNHNERMHPRNRYKTRKPDFAELAVKHPRFTKYVQLGANGKAHLDFKDPYANKAFTQALLKEDFGLTWDIPIQRLCPALTVRLNYVHWVEDLLALRAGGAAAGPVKGIDVGTGASAIYALLGATMNKWQFVATELDPESVISATRNVTNNNLQSLIQVRKAPSSTSFLLPTITAADGDFAFTMCNPPFFKTLVDAVANPANASMGQCVELVYPGGEVAFVDGIVADSKVLGRRVTWYTTMLGRKASLKHVFRSVTAAGATATRTTRFMQGHTIRWGIAWTFTPLDQFVAGVNLQPNKTFKTATKAVSAMQARFQVQGASEVETKQRIKEALVALKTAGLRDDSPLEALANTWDTLHACWKDKGVDVTFDVTTTEYETGVEVLLTPVDMDTVAVSQGVSEVKAAFRRLVDVVQRDTVRTSRKWRRLLKRKEDAGSRPTKRVRTTA